MASFQALFMGKPWTYESSPTTIVELSKIELAVHTSRTSAAVILLHNYQYDSKGIFLVFHIQKVYLSTVARSVTKQINLICQFCPY